MSWIKCGTRVAFRDSTENITAEKPYTVWHDHRGRPYFYDDDCGVKMGRVVSPKCLRNAGGRIVFEPDTGSAEAPKGTRTALIEALKARLEAVKDAPIHTPENSEQFWIVQALERAYGIRATIVPGPSTVTFTEL